MDIFNGSMLADSGDSRNYLKIDRTQTRRIITNLAEKNAIQSIPEQQVRKIWPLVHFLKENNA
jgi:hypothetical protein